MWIEGGPCRVRLLGEAAAQWIPFARAKLALLRRARLPGRAFALPDGGLVQVQFCGAEAVLTIQAGLPWLVVSLTLANGDVFTGNVVRKPKAEGDEWAVARMLKVFASANAGFGLKLMGGFLWVFAKVADAQADRFWSVPWGTGGKRPPAGAYELVAPGVSNGLKARFVVPRPLTAQQEAYPYIGYETEPGGSWLQMAYRVENPSDVLGGRTFFRLRRFDRKGVLRLDLPEHAVAGWRRDMESSGRSFWLFATFVNRTAQDMAAGRAPNPWPIHTDSLYRIDAATGAVAAPLRLAEVPEDALFQLVAGGATALGATGISVRTKGIYVAVRQVDQIAPFPTDTHRYPWRGTFKSVLRVYDPATLSVKASYAVAGGLWNIEVDRAERYVTASRIVEVRHAVEQDAQGRYLDALRQELVLYVIEPGRLRLVAVLFRQTVYLLSHLVSVSDPTPSATLNGDLYLEESRLPQRDFNVSS